MDQLTLNSLFAINMYNLCFYSFIRHIFEFEIGFLQSNVCNIWACIIFHIYKSIIHMFDLFSGIFSNITVYVNSIFTFEFLFKELKYI